MTVVHLSYLDTGRPICRWREAARDYEMTKEPREVTCKSCLKYIPLQLPDPEDIDREILIFLEGRLAPCRFDEEGTQYVAEIFPDNIYFFKETPDA